VIQCFVFTFVLLLAMLANGQASLGAGRVEGTIVDSSGAAVAGSTVLIANQDTGISFTQKSDSTGHFVFLSLPPGSYQVTIQKAGFKTDVSSDVLVQVGTTTNLQRRLVVGAIDIRVSVVAEAPLVDTSQSGLSAVVDQKEISSLPLNGRNFTDFVLLTPGVSTDGDFGMISFNGLAGNYNNYTVDGANDNNAFFEQQIGRTSIPFQFSEDIVQEFQVISNGFDAEFGQAGGGVVNTVTKSGTNQFHGDGYYYFLDSGLDANDKVNEQQGITKPHNRRQQFGGTVGGPVIHDRFFWVANYEGQVRNEPLTVNEGPALQTIPITEPTYLADHPDVAALVSAAAGSHARSFNQNTMFGKVSGVLGDKNTFDVSYNYQRFRSPHGYFNTPTSTGDGLGLTDGATSHFLQFTLHSAFSATTVNEFRFHFGNDFHLDLPDTPPTGPAVVIQDPDKGVVLGGNRFQLSNSDRRFEFGDNLTKVWGRHTMKAGVDINLNHDRDYFVYGPHGAYFFAGLTDVGGDPSSNKAPGNFEFYLQSFGQSTTTFTVPTYSLFGQDQFRLNNHLTLNYGVRWDLQKLPKPPNCNPAFLMTCSIPYSKNNFAPRVGFAYALGQKNTTMVRGAFGLFYAMTDLLDVSQALTTNGINSQFLFVPGPSPANPNPLVTYPNYFTAFPAGAGGSPSLVVFSPKFRSPYVEQGNLQIEKQIGSRTAFSVGYVYTHGLQLLGNSNGVTRQANGNFGLDINLFPPALQPSQGGFATDTLQMPNGKVFTVPDYGAIDGYLNPNFGAINEIDNSGLSIYHGLQVSLRHNSSQFQGGVSYTFSKTIDQGTGYYNQFAIASQRGLSQLDQPHRLVLTGTWSPTQHFVKGFTLGSVMTFASGRPFEPELDVANVNFKMVPGEGFNSFRGPGVNNIDLNLARVVRINERMSVKFVAEAFDLLNHPNFQQSPVNQVQYKTKQSPTDPTVYAASPNPDFGKPLAVASRYGARAMQLSARFSF
jgi:Carboxypeptidase regulatory-like domain/TonB dependent receptor/TonB-dependent Receptor Plug Domain